VTLDVGDRAPTSSAEPRPQKRVGAWNGQQLMAEVIRQTLDRLLRSDAYSDYAYVPSGFKRVVEFGHIRWLTCQ
jgi:hypothetical protein